MNNNNNKDKKIIINNFKDLYSFFQKLKYLQKV